MILSPSLLSANFGKLAEECRDLEKAGVPCYHDTILLCVVYTMIYTITTNPSLDYTVEADLIPGRINRTRSEVISFSRRNSGSRSGKSIRTSGISTSLPPQRRLP